MAFASASASLSLKLDPNLVINRPRPTHSWVHVNPPSALTPPPIIHLPAHHGQGQGHHSEVDLPSSISGSQSRTHGRRLSTPNLLNVTPPPSLFLDSHERQSRSRSPSPIPPAPTRTPPPPPTSAHLNQNRKTQVQVNYQNADLIPSLTTSHSHHPISHKPAVRTTTNLYPRGKGKADGGDSWYGRPRSIDSNFDCSPEPKAISRRQIRELTSEEFYSPPFAAKTDPNILGFEDQNSGVEELANHLIAASGDFSLCVKDEEDNEEGEEKEEYDWVIIPPACYASDTTGGLLYPGANARLHGKWKGKGSNDKERKGSDLDSGLDDGNDEDDKGPKKENSGVTTSTLRFLFNLLMAMKGHNDTDGGNSSDDCKKEQVEAHAHDVCSDADGLRNVTETELSGKCAKND